MKRIIASVVGTCILLGAYGVMASSSCCSSSSSDDKSSSGEEQAVVEGNQDSSTVEYSSYDLSEIRSDIESNPLREENYLNQGMILTGVIDSISTSSLNISSTNEGEDMYIRASVSNYSSDALMSLNIGDMVQVRGICTDVTSYSINIDVTDISVLQDTSTVLQNRIDAALANVEGMEVITMDQLYDEARSNPAAFANYEGQWLIIEGSLEETSEYFGFRVGDSGNNCDLECTFFDDRLEQEITEYSIGQNIIVVGQVDSLINANENLGNDPASDFMEGFADGLMDISLDGFNMYFTVYSVELAE